MTTSAPRGRSTIEPPTGTGSGQRIRAVLEQLIDENARRAERMVVLVRFLILAAGGISLVSTNLRFGLPGAHLAYVIAAVTAAALVNVVILLRVARAERAYPLLLVSVVSDHVLILGLLASHVLWPEPGYRGILQLVVVGIIPLAVAASGLRLHRRLALVSAWVGLGLLASLLAIDRALNADVVAYGAADLVSLGVLFLTGAAVGVVMAQRTERMVFEAARVAAKAERARDRLRVYVSEDAAREALDGSDDALSLDGKQRHVAVLFCDLRGFTAYANTIDPKQLVAELNAYFDAMVPVLQARGGTIDKFMGDSIMAVFTAEPGAPSPAARAIEAALATADALIAHNESRVAMGRPPLRHGIGLHAGWAVAGNVGTQDRVQYTVIGDVVNVASRLEKATKELGRWLVCSADAWSDAVRADPALGAALESLGPVELRGVDGAIEVYAPRAESDPGLVAARVAAR